ncbi:N-6 DNA methylase [Shewanella fidelis]|uniref:N-6 DNA methylase n=1 Tax=Shewanella fidelis TaxID=173509 RepID=A0AAW8NT78_9GAMM|nr:N-6 DNA methylase [Shewanella fidelis]MDR8525455.1 N-6 DNA methylase [Shewanella fidelis]MDW4816894.1 N-6 DNA methylase [Shewanella fidelis]MDW4825691.1 N-6 DNA methylase [Shewanella fidelis]
MVKEAKAKKTDPKQQLEQLFNNLSKQHTEFTQPLNELPKHEFAKAGLIQGLDEGNLTPPVMLVSLLEGHWEYAADTAKFDDLAYQLLSDIEGDWPVFAVVADGSNHRILALFGADGSDGTHGVDSLPSLEELRNFDRLERDPTFRWSMRVYTRLMQRFDAFHESVYRVRRDKVTNKNSIIYEVAKVLFLESFRVHHAKDLTFIDHEGNTCLFNEVFDYNYVRDNGEKAVSQIKAAFKALKSHPDYIVTADDGAPNGIFDEDEYLKLSVPENYVDLLEAIQNLGPVKSNDGKTVKEHGTLGDVSGDLLGRVFDVFLRANFESKGGLGVYLTPNPVKQAMIEMAMHDIANDDAVMAKLSNGDFKFCDPTCGSFGFGSVALSQIDTLVDVQLGGLSDDEKVNLKKKLRDTSFTGADNSTDMIMLARVNMALQNAPKAQIIHAYNSLNTPALKPNSFDLICTNPPFGTPKFGKDKNSQVSKKNYEFEMEQILGGIRPAQKVVDSYNAYYDHLKMKWVDTGNLELDENGEPKWAGFRTDLRRTGGTVANPVYSLQPTTSGLALGSKPKAKGWGPVGATIDPAVLFIDRCLQLLKPGGRLMIVLPDGILCNSGDRYVREYIMGKKDEQTGEFVGGKAIVKAVISLPGDCFKLSGTGAKTSILYLQKRHANPNQLEKFLPEPQTDVFMAVAETLGYVVKNNIEDYNAGVTNDLDKIVSAYKRGE